MESKRAGFGPTVGLSVSGFQEAFDNVVWDSLRRYGCRAGEGLKGGTLVDVWRLPE